MGVISFLVVTFFGIGFLLFALSKGKISAGGTMGSLAALCLLHALPRSGIEATAYNTLGIILSFIVGLIFLGRGEAYIRARWGSLLNHRGKQVEFDYNQTCIDEVHGMFVAASSVYIFSMPFWWVYIAFIFFRILDSAKPRFLWITQSEAWGMRIGIPFGIMIDDTVAGAWAALCNTLLFWIVLLLFPMN